MKNNGIDITKAYHNGIEITAIMHNGVDVGAFTPPTPDYQPWENYPDSPVLTSEYPYQVIGKRNTTDTFLIFSKNKIYRDGVYLRVSNYNVATDALLYYYYNNVWNYNTNGASEQVFVEPLLYANNDIYADDTLTFVYFAKTTA